MKRKLKSMVRIAALFTFSFSLFTLSSCSEDDLGGEPGKGNNGNGGDIRFEIGFAGQTSAGGPQTRAATLSDFTSKFENGDEIGIFAVANGDPLAASGNPIHNVKLTYTETTPGNPSTGSWSGPAYWPTSASGITSLDFYAYYPYDASATNPQDIAFNIATDQSAAADHNKSDLLTAKTANKGKTDGAVPLTFSHALAMVQVSIPKEGKGFGPSTGLTVTLRGVKPVAALDLNTISTTPGSEITVPASNNDPVNITMYRLEQPGDSNYETDYTYRALVPAQDVAAGSSLFLFDHEGRTLLRDGALSQAVTMTAGTAEKFERTMPATMIETVKIPLENMPFTMGESGISGATPHPVTLTKNFRMGKYQVTNAQYAAFLNAKGVQYETSISNSWISGNGGKCTWGDDNGQIMILTNSWGVTYDNVSNTWKAQTGYENHPVIYVTWFGANEYAKWIGGTLPTEAQWEYACRAGTTTSWATESGTDNDLGNYAWYSLNSAGATHEVGTTPKANPWGLYDMHGNVLEWCSDAYKSDYETLPNTDPENPGTSGDYRVLRGGCWYIFAQLCRSAYRNRNYPGNAINYVGFRVAVVP